MSPLPVLCFPFAGAGASVYRPVRDHASRVRVVPVQLPGREDRFGERPGTDAVRVVADLLPTLVADIAGGGEAALFGHSLGAALAFEAARQLTEDARVRVVHLVVSGSPGPWTRREEPASGLTEDEFLTRVRQLAGYTHPALEHPELREMLLPALRADVAMHEGYAPASREPLAVPVTSVRGQDDDLVSADQAGEWAAATRAAFGRVEVPGGHMYLVETPHTLVRLLEDTLTAPAGSR